MKAMDKKEIKEAILREIFENEEVHGRMNIEKKVCGNIYMVIDGGWHAGRVWLEQVYAYDIEKDEDGELWFNADDIEKEVNEAIDDAGVGYEDTMYNHYAF